eukprot:879109-Alexandrium_andersonii.AAC.1
MRRVSPALRLVPCSVCRAGVHSEPACSGRRLFLLPPPLQHTHPVERRRGRLRHLRHGRGRLRRSVGCNCSGVRRSDAHG